MLDSSLYDRKGKLKEFSRLRELMLNASRSSSTAISSIFTEDQSVSNQSVFHYDIRDGDSLIEEPTDTKPSDFRVVTLGGSSLSAASFSPRVRHSATQTSALSEAAELEELRNDLVPHLEGSLSMLEVSVADTEEKCCRIVSRLKSSVILEYVKGKIHDSNFAGEFYILADEQSIDVFKEAFEESPELSLSLRGSSLRVSAKQRELSFYNLKSLKFTIYVSEMDRFRKLLFTFKLLGVPVSLVDVPEDIVSKLAMTPESGNPRRQLARDI